MRGVGYGRAALAAAAWVNVAQAQTAALVDFDIPVQPMAGALNAWALQANAQLFVDPNQVAQLSAPAVKGSFEPRQALHALLLHSNLEVLQGTDGVLVIKPRPVVVAAKPKPAASVAVAEAPAPQAPGPYHAAHGARG